MDGLNLIKEYYSDSDEDTKRLNNQTKVFNVKNEQSKLPLPEFIASWKGVMHHEEISDDPSKHEGRIRSFKHERGNWATLVYVNYIPNDDMLQWINNIVVENIKTVNIFQEFHVSLTRTLVLKFHWIDSFVEAIRNITNSYSSFFMELNNLKVYCNEDETRTFMGITIQSTNDSLQRLTYTLDKLLNEYQLPLFYKDASYHISFLWWLGDQRKMLETILPSLSTSFYDFLKENPEQRFIQIDKLNCKIGNKLYNFNFR